MKREKEAYEHDYLKERTKQEVVDWISNHIDFDIVGDFGCGKINYPFKNVIRIDGNPEAKPQILHDLSEPINVVCDLAFSIEVAEHIPESGADVFVDSLTKYSKWVVMTTCKPIVRNIDKTEYRNLAHLNEQPKEYWIEKFKKRGFEYKEDLTNKMQDHFLDIEDSMRWFKEDVIIFKKV